MGRKQARDTAGPPATEQDARAARLKAALKQNMQRRKAQARARAADKTDTPGAVVTPDTPGAADRPAAPGATRTAPGDEPQA